MLVDVRNGSSAGPFLEPCNLRLYTARWLRLRIQRGSTWNLCSSKFPGRSPRRHSRTGPSCTTSQLGGTICDFSSRSSTRPPGSINRWRRSCDRSSPRARRRHLIGTHCGGRTRAAVEPFLLSPVDHPDPHHVLVSGTGLSHLGSMQSRDEMHRAADSASGETTQAHQPLTDSGPHVRPRTRGGEASRRRAGRSA